MSISKINTTVYAVKIKNRDTLMQSSSGGAFTALSDVLLSYAGAIVCAVYDYRSMKTVFRLITTCEERNFARGSKYMQSIPGDIFLEALNWLEEHPNKELLFVGLGCQAEGFLRFAELRGIRDRVYIVDLICHGATSPKIWTEYAKFLESCYKGRIKYLTFREKRKGLPSESVLINGKKIPIKDYTTVFYSRCVNRLSCHVCPFTTTERNTDITIGDFWHIDKKIPEFYDRNGVSLLLLHTERGESLFEQVKSKIDFRESNTEDCWQYNLEYPTPVSENRTAFWKDYSEYGVKYVMKKYGTFTLGEKIKNRIKKYLR